MRQIVESPEEQSGFRARALETLLDILGNDAVDVLLAVTADPEFQVRWRAVVRLGDKRALPVLETLNASNTAEWEVQPGFRLTSRRAAAEAIERIQRGGG